MTASLLPCITGSRAELETTLTATRDEPVFLKHSDVRLDQVHGAFACALHMHQPTIPAGVNGELISNLQHMLEGSNDGDRYNASIYATCYSRMGDMIPDLVAEGCSPRIMLDYSGNLLWGLQQLGRQDILDKLRRITCEPQFQPHVEWLGTMWSHAVVPSTPVPDIKLHIQAWQFCFADMFGMDALKRVRGFSPPEMHLPNHPDVLYEYVTALLDCGYRWVMVQEDSIETLDGKRLERADKYVPNRLVARNCKGETASITVLIKTQGSDTKLVAQNQPYHEAKTLSKVRIGGVDIPPLVTQIADGENGGVMMNEFPRDFPRPWQDMKGSQSGGVVGMTGTEYLELIEAAGVSPSDYPQCQAVNQHLLWARLGSAKVTPEAVEQAIGELKASNHQFHMEGGSWTNDLSWVRGYDNVLQPMMQLSARFHEKYDARLKADEAGVTQTQEYKEALLYNLLVQTSCFRYWGQGTWTDYARDLYARGMVALQ